MIATCWSTRAQSALVRRSVTSTPAPPLQRRAAQDPNFDKPTLRQSIARLNHTSDADIETALEEGFRQQNWPASPRTG